MKKVQVLHALVALAVTAVVILGPSQASAESYSLPTLTPQPTGWCTMSQDHDPAPFTAGGTTDVSMTGVAPSVLAGFGGAAETALFGQDFTLGSTVAWSNTTELGLAARSDASTMCFYYAGFNPVNNYFSLVRIIGGTNVLNLDTENMAGVITTGQDWDITLTVDGTSLAATLSQGGSQLASLSASDSTFSSGQFGVFMFKVTEAAPSGQWTDAYIVPEPATLGLLLLGAFGVLVRARRS